MGWWLIHTDDLRAALQAVAEGDHPDVVMAELYANADHEDYDSEAP